MESSQPKKHSTPKRISPLMWMGCFFILACITGIYVSRSWNGSANGVRTTEKVLVQDSLPFMHSVGVSTLISDSGVIRYHLVAEEWDIFTPNDKQATWKFIKGLLMLRLDEEFDVDLYVQADTAYLHEQKMWELRGRVRIKNVQGTVFNTEELFWDLNKHEMWNHTHISIITPERTLEGTEFRSNEQMTRYSVANSKGTFPMSDAEGDNANTADSTTTENTTQKPVTTNIPPQISVAKPRSTNPTKVLEPAPTKFDFKKEK
jgi:LPS export ABC transporter protein LptC